MIHPAASSPLLMDSTIPESNNIADATLDFTTTSSAPVATSFNEADSAQNDRLEAAYWEFDARHKGMNEWTGRPQSERDAFKATLRSVIQREFALGSQVKTDE